MHLQSDRHVSHMSLLLRVLEVAWAWHGTGSSTSSSKEMWPGGSCLWYSHLTWATSPLN